VLTSHKAFAKTHRGLCSQASLRSGLVLRCDSLLRFKYAMAGGVRLTQFASLRRSGLAFNPALHKAFSLK
jgi:hypothetical protein